MKTGDGAWGKLRNLAQAGPKRLRSGYGQKYGDPLQARSEAWARFRAIAQNPVESGRTPLESAERG
jgi:hypothetical protein